MAFRLLSIAAASLLWGMFLLKLQVVFLIGLALSGLGFLMSVSKKQSVDRLSLLILINFAYWIGSGLLVGGVSLTDLVSLAFISDGGGRIFVYYLPLLAFANIGADIRLANSMTRQASVMAILLTPMFAIWWLAQPDVLSGGAANNFFGLLTSHTGAGTFFATLALFLGIQGMRLRRRGLLLLAFMALIATFGSASRQSIAGIVAVVLWYFARDHRLRTLFRGALIATGMAIVMARIAPHTYERTVRVLRPATLKAVVTTARSAEWESGQPMEVDSEQFNILSRVLFWNYAVRLFTESPWIGVGFERYDDRNIHLVEMAGGVAQLALDGERVFSDKSAHNSYLHILAESGIVGLALLMGIWLIVILRLRETTRFARGHREFNAYLTACEGLVVFVAVGAFFDHALASPSVGIPILTLIGVVLSIRRQLICANNRAARKGNERA